MAIVEPVEATEPVELVEPVASIVQAEAPIEEAEPAVEEPAFAGATAYDRILSEVEEPEPYVIEETVSVAETFTGFAEAMAGDTASLEATVDRPTSAEATLDRPAFADPAVTKPPVPVEPAAGKPLLPFEPGVVLPLTRTVRIEVPPRTGPSRAASGIDRLLRIAAARGATALFLTSESRPWIRLEGDLRYLDSETPLSRADVESAILEIAPESGHESIGKGEPTEWIAEFENVGRIRCTTFMDHRGPGVLLRMIATKAATAEQLGLAREVQALATEAQGLVLVAGPRASGKSTLISALVDLVNRQRAST